LIERTPLINIASPDPRLDFSNVKGSKKEKIMRIHKWNIHEAGSLGDYLSQDQESGGLELGTMGTSAIFLVIILSLVIFLTKTRRDEIPCLGSSHE
jgi:hypothetical protein